MNNKFQQNFNTFTNIFILFILFFGGFVWADTNGVWQYASDTRGGIFGADEQAFTTNFTFINPVNFYDKLSISKNLGISHIIINSVNSYSAIEFSNSSDNKWGIGKDSQDNFYIDETGISNRLLIKKGGNTRIKGNLEVNSGNFSLGSVKNCNGKLVTDSSGNVYCGVDIVNDSDHVIGNEVFELTTGSGITKTGTKASGYTISAADISPTNELPLAGTGITIGADGRTISIDTTTIATKSYVNNNGISSIINTLEAALILGGPDKTIFKQSGSGSISGKSKYFVMGCGGGARSGDKSCWERSETPADGILRWSFNVDGVNPGPGTGGPGQSSGRKGGTGVSVNNVAIGIGYGGNGGRYNAQILGSAGGAPLSDGGGNWYAGTGGGGGGFTGAGKQGEASAPGGAGYIAPGKAGGKAGTGTEVDSRNSINLPNGFRFGSFVCDRTIAPCLLISWI